MSLFHESRYASYIRRKEFTDSKIQKLRVRIGLKPLRSGDRTCLHCSQLFFTRDLNNQKMCDRCRSTYHEDDGSLL